MTRNFFIKNGKELFLLKMARNIVIENGLKNQGTFLLKMKGNFVLKMTRNFSIQNDKEFFN